MVSIHPDPRPGADGLRLAGFPEARLAAVGFALLPAATVVHRAGIGVRPAGAAFAVVVVLTGLGLPRVHAAALGLTAWAMLTGFVVNELGELSFAPADLARLVLLVAVALSAAGLGRRRTRWSPGQPAPTRSRGGGSTYGRQRARATIAAPSRAPER